MVAAVVAALAAAKRKKKAAEKSQTKLYEDGTDDEEDNADELARKMARLEQMRREIDTDGDAVITREELRAWKEDIGGVKWLPHRKIVRDFYNRQSTQIVVGVVIVANFVVAILQREFDPYPSEYQRHRVLWEALDDAFNTFFILELCINVYGSFIIPFFRNYWNYLDLMVVVLGVFSLARLNSISQINFVRVIRTFRVVRLFKRLKSLNTIINAVIKSIPGVASAFLIMFIIMSIYAIISVDNFREFGQAGEYHTSQTFGEADAQYGVECGLDALECISGSKLDGAFRNSTAVSSITSRNIYYGQEYYGTYSRALFTQFQVLTGESWAEAVARPLLYGSSSPSQGLMVALFFATYIVLVQVILQNVVVAVLIEKFTDGQQSMEEEELNDDLEMLGRMAAGENPLARSTTSKKKLQVDRDRMNSRVDASFQQIFETGGPPISAPPTTSSPSTQSSPTPQRPAGPPLGPPVKLPAVSFPEGGGQPNETAEMLRLVLKELAALREDQQAMAKALREMTDSSPSRQWGGGVGTMMA